MSQMSKKFKKSSKKKRPFTKREGTQTPEDVPVKAKKMRKEKIEALATKVAIGDKFEWTSSMDDDTFTKLSCYVFLNKVPKQFRITIDSRTKGKYRTDIPFDDIRHIFISNAQCILVTRIPSLFEKGSRFVDDMIGEATTRWSEFRDADWHSVEKNTNINIIKINFKENSWKDSFIQKIFEADSQLQSRVFENANEIPNLDEIKPPTQKKKVKRKKAVAEN